MFAALWAASSQDQKAPTPDQVTHLKRKTQLLQSDSTKHVDKRMTRHYVKKLKLKRRPVFFFSYFLEVLHHSLTEYWALLIDHLVHWPERKRKWIIRERKELHYRCWWIAKKTKNKTVCSKPYKINGWSQAGLVVFFKTEVFSLCGGSSSCITHKGLMLPANTAQVNIARAHTHVGYLGIYTYIYINKSWIMHRLKGLTEKEFRFQYWEGTATQWIHLQPKRPRIQLYIGLLWLARDSAGRLSVTPPSEDKEQIRGVERSVMSRLCIIKGRPEYWRGRLESMIHS